MGKKRQSGCDDTAHGPNDDSEKPGVGPINGLIFEGCDPAFEAGGLCSNCGNC